MRYSVFTYIIGDYENVREVRERDPEAEYILVTDNQKLRSETWTIVYDASLDGLPVMEKCYRVRYNPFKYCNTQLCFRIDSSIVVLRSLKPIVDAFENGGYNMGLMLHPLRDNLKDEYDAWVKIRGYSPKQAEKCLSYVAERGYDLSYRGLFQLTMAIQRRDAITEQINRETFEAMREVSPVGDFERVDQTLFSYLLNGRYSHLKIMPLSERLIRSAFLQWCCHGSCNENIGNTPLDNNDVGELYMFNRRTSCVRFYPETFEDREAREHELLMKWWNAINDWHNLKGELLSVTADRDAVRCELASVVAERDAVRCELASVVAERDAVRCELASVLDSQCWRITAPVRRCLDSVKRMWFATKGGTEIVSVIFYIIKMITPFGIVRIWEERRCGIRIDMPLLFYPGWRKRVKRLIKFCLPYGIVKRVAKPFVDMYAVPSDARATCMIWECRTVIILCTRHVLYIARLMERVLTYFGKRVKIITKEPNRYGSEAYIVICPQMFRRLPLNYAAFQLEQTVSSRWLTPEYIKQLNGAMPVFDYSLKNIEYWLKNGIPSWRLYYLPIDFLPGMGRISEKRKYDVVFYGDPTALRRQEILHKLSEHYRVHVVSEVFGEKLYAELSQAKIIVNIHYYENAMLETTRLYEALSLGGSVIISERSSDPEEEKRLEGIVDFVDVGDVPAMNRRIDYWLGNEEARQAAVVRNHEKLKDRGNAFDYFFARYLLAFGVISFDQFYEFAGKFVAFNVDRICLSLPESIDRHREFVAENKYGFEFFPALRHLRGWTGCGLSYKFIMKKAKEQGLNRVTVCEDDVGFPADFVERLSASEKYLDSKQGWHVFQGMMADVGRVTIKAVEYAFGQTFVKLDHMISTVYNIYDKSVYDCFLRWDERNADPQTNTIDRALEGQNLNIVTTSPFLVDHKEELQSDLWGLSNSDLYKDLIKDSREKLANLIKDYESGQQPGRKVMA